MCFQWIPDSYCLFLFSVLQAVDPVQPPPADISCKLIMPLQLIVFLVPLCTKGFVPWTFLKLTIPPPSPAVFRVPQDLLDPVSLHVIYYFCLMLILYFRFKLKTKKKLKRQNNLNILLSHLLCKPKFAPPPFTQTGSLLMVVRTFNWSPGFFWHQKMKILGQLIWFSVFS